MSQQDSFDWFNFSAKTFFNELYFVELADRLPLNDAALS
jgi:hypothetical protein